MLTPIQYCFFADQPSVDFCVLCHTSHFRYHMLVLTYTLWTLCSALSATVKCGGKKAFRSSGTPIETVRSAEVESFPFYFFFNIRHSYVNTLAACTLPNFCMVFRNRIYVIASGWLLYVLVYIHILYSATAPASAVIESAASAHTGHWPLVRRQRIVWKVE